jgi:prepilin-type N-terminal cleavage/methylation domain-containing protein
MRRGVTLVELLMVVTIMGILSAVVVPGAGRAMDRWAVEHQTMRIVLAYREAWVLARSQHRLALLRISADSIAIRTVRSAGSPDTSLSSIAPGPRLAGVELKSPAHTAVFGPDGVGMGAANTTHVLAKGSVTRRIVVSRLGRVRVM